MTKIPDDSVFYLPGKLFVLLDGGLSLLAGDLGITDEVSGGTLAPGRSVTRPVVDLIVGQIQVFHGEWVAGHRATGGQAIVR